MSHSDSSHEQLYQKLRDKAYRLLARREHSAWELRRKLQVVKIRRAERIAADEKPGDQDMLNFDKPDSNEFDSIAIESSMFDRLLCELIELDAQSDSRFTEQRCRWRYQTGKGPLKLRHELSQHQIAAPIIEQAMAAYDEKWEALAFEVRRKKFGEKAPTSFKEWARQARFLQQRGFGSAHIKPYDK